MKLCFLVYVIRKAITLGACSLFEFTKRTKENGTFPLDVLKLLKLPYGGTDQ